MYLRRRVAVLLVLCTAMLVSCGTNPSTNKSGAPLTSIEVMPTTPSIAKGTTQTFTATGRYSDNTSADITGKVQWNSSDTTVAAVDSNGTALGSNPGAASIQAQVGEITGTTVLTVTDAALRSIEVTPTNPSIVAGTTRQFTASGVFSDNSTQDVTASVTWSSSSRSIATISNTAGSNGMATSLDSGTTMVTANSGNISGSTTLTVTSAALVSVAVAPTNPSIVAGTDQQFSATGTFSNNATQDLTSAASWESSATSIATIGNSAGSKGKASALAAGTASITAVFSAISGSTTLTVTPATLESIEITPKGPDIAIGTTQQFTAKGRYSDNTTQDLTAPVVWDSSDSLVATISNADGTKGKAYSVTTGTTMITAISGTVSDSTTLTISPVRLSSIDIAPADPSIALGTTQQFTATGTYTNASTQDLTTSVTWSSSSMTVAAISNAAGSRGLATPIGTGTTTITAISDIVSRSTTLTVTPATLISIDISPADTTIAPGKTRQFIATGTYSNATAQDISSLVTWSSSASAIATISNADGSRGLATPVSAGTTTISAISGGISKSTTLTVLHLIGGSLQGNDLSLTGEVTTVAGIRQWADGLGSAAIFNHPVGITSDGTYLYVADTNNSAIRKVYITTGNVTTLAGNAGISGSTDGTGTAATFRYPRGITTDGTYLYVADTEALTIRKIAITTGAVTKIAGMPGTIAPFFRPGSVTLTGGYLYVADTNNNVIRKLDTSGGYYPTLDGLFAGATLMAGLSDGTAADARFNGPSGITTDGTYLFASDTGNNTIRKIRIDTGDVTTIAGTAGSSGSIDATGSAARFNGPTGIATDGTNLYVTDTGNNIIRKIVIATGAVTTIAGTTGSSGSTDASGVDARFTAQAVRDSPVRLTVQDPQPDSTVHGALQRTV